jgi:hypothetical protein
MIFVTQDVAAMTEYEADGEDGDISVKPSIALS